MCYGIQINLCVETLSVDCALIPIYCYTSMCIPLLSNLVMSGGAPGGGGGPNGGGGTGGGGTAANCRTAGGGNARLDILRICIRGGPIDEGVAVYPYVTT